MVEGVGAFTNTTLVAGVVTAVIAYLWIYRWRQRNSLGPKTWPILGCYLETRANSNRLHEWVTEYMKKSPTATISTYLLGSPFVWIGRPDNVEFVLKSHFSNFPKGALLYDRSQDLLGNGIFAVDGDIWKQHRKIASVEFSSRKLRDFSTAAYRAHAVRLVHILDAAATEQNVVDFQDLALRMTMDSICKVGFGVDFGSLSPDLPDIKFSRAFDNASETTSKRQFGLAWKLLRLLDLGSEKQLRKDMVTVNEFTYDVISTRRAQLLALEAAGKELEMYDLLSRFMSTTDENGKRLTDQVLRDAILNFVVAGRDTTAVTLTWFVYCLINNPEVAEKCLEELLTVVTADDKSVDDFADLLTFQTLGSLPYLHATISETLRLYPAVPKDTKYASKACVLPDGTFLEKGSSVTYHQYAMGRLESVWGPDAEQFRPERWFNQDGVLHMESTFKFTAFQGGPRVCLGKDAAYIQMKITAALLVRFFEFHLVPDHPIQYRFSLVMQLRHGLKVNLSHRYAPFKKQSPAAGHVSADSHSNFH